MTTCPFKVRKRDTQELVQCPDKANYIITIEGKPPFRCCAIHRTRYKKEGVAISYQPLKGDALSSPTQTAASSKSKTGPLVITVPSSTPPPTKTTSTTSTTPPSAGLYFAPPRPDNVIKAAAVKKAPLRIPPPPPPVQQVKTSVPPPQPVMINDRVEVIDKMLHPIYSEMFATACNMRIRQKASTKYSTEDMEKVLALGSLKEDEVEKATKQGKDAKKAIAGEKALRELNGGSSTVMAPSHSIQPTSPPPPQQMLYQQPPMMPPQVSMMPMGMMPQMVVPTHFAPVPSNAFIDAPAPPIPVGIGGVQQMEDGEPIPMMQQQPQPQPTDQMSPQGGMVPDANGVLRFQGGVMPGGMQVGGDTATQPQQPQKLSGNALTMTMRQNRNGIIGFFSLIEHVAGAFGFPGAVGTAKRLSKDPAFEQCLTELLEPEPDVDGKEKSPLDILKISEDDHPILKTLKLYSGHLANNALNYGTGKASMALSKDVIANAQADIDAVTQTAPTSGQQPPPKQGLGVPDESNEMLPRPTLDQQQQSLQSPQATLPPPGVTVSGVPLYNPTMPPVVLPNSNDQMFVMPFTPSSYTIVPTSTAPVDPLYKKADRATPQASQQQQSALPPLRLPPTDDSSSLLDTD